MQACVCVRVRVRVCVRVSVADVVGVQDGGRGVRERGADEREMRTFI